MIKKATLLIEGNINGFMEQAIATKDEVNRFIEQADATTVKGNPFLDKKATFQISFEDDPLVAVLYPLYVDHRNPLIARVWTYDIDSKDMFDRVIPAETRLAFRQLCLDVGIMVVPR